MAAEKARRRDRERGEKKSHIWQEERESEAAREQEKGRGPMRTASPRTELERLGDAACLYKGQKDLLHVVADVSHVARPEPVAPPARRKGKRAVPKGGHRHAQ